MLGKAMRGVWRCACWGWDPVAWVWGLEVPWGDGKVEEEGLGWAGDGSGRAGIT